MTDSFLMVVRQYCKKHRVSDKVREFWLAHPRCEICGNWSEHPHHCRSRGSGGDDEWINLLALCTTHHTEVHQMGRKTFAERNPQIALKLAAALERSRA